jgi:hypothetical protein
MPPALSLLEWVGRNPALSSSRNPSGSAEGAGVGVAACLTAGIVIVCRQCGHEIATPDSFGSLKICPRQYGHANAYMAAPC